MMNTKIYSASITLTHIFIRRGLWQGLILSILLLSSSVVAQPAGQGREIERFITHKVKKRETLYSIGKLYGVTEDDIKRFNTQLYSEQLKKRMKIRVPRFKEVEETGLPKNLVEEQEIISYVVQPKETIWSLAHHYGLTIDELKTLNPQITSGLKAGETLTLPKKAPIEKVSTDHEKGRVHIVQPKETIYGLTKRYDVSVEELGVLNPSIKDGLKIGMELVLPESAHQRPMEYLYYEVKPKDTLFSLERKLQMNRASLEELNPMLKEGLKAGMILKLPTDQASNALDIDDNVLVEPFNIIDSIQAYSRVKLAFMIPFKLRTIEMDSLNEAKKRLKQRNLYTVALDFYAGAKTAIDFAAEQGISVEAKVFDTENSKTRIEQIINEHSFKEYQAVIGPFFPENVAYAASRLNSDRIPVVSPISGKRTRFSSNLFASVPKVDLLQERMISYLKENSEGKNILIIADSDHKGTKERLARTFPSAKVIEVYKDSYISIPNIKDQIKEYVENWVILETNKLGLVSSVTSSLNSQLSDTKRITLFTTNRGDVYDHPNSTSNTYLSALQFHFPSDECPSRQEPYKEFPERFHDTYHMVPNREATRGFDVTLDIILKLAYKPDLYEATSQIMETHMSQGRFMYAKKLLGGYQNNGIFIVSYKELRLHKVR